ncbi:MAG: hypothetical protein OM95_15055 [Bdellovibrio sp. ArHS]|uniref:hypothetical protein n=1 Tax=Bdellovibrio sp. ArHS TaxID=1569284 RepID=UPI00058373C9|nr:hypothetical protein [Bdellovibrio sp. ArHS]KHD87334.1 MAG: hypothetical protein OM95_15055 [Bdellovibrio sp. ArHS]
MSSISSSDRARQDDKIRQTREEYENRESENAKRRNAELKRLEQRHSEEIRNITDNYEERIAELKERNRETLTDRDFENNRKIDEVRQTYRESLRNKMEDAYNTREEQKAAYEGELRKQKEISQSQKENLVGQMNSEVLQRDERFAQMSEENRLKAQQTVHNNARKLNEAHEKEKSAMQAGFQDTLRSHTRSADEVRKSYESRLRQSERQREADNSRWSQKYTDTVVNKSEEYADNLEMKQMILDGERETIRGKYENTLAKKTDIMDGQNQDFRDSVNERVNSQVRSRDSQIQRLNSKLNNEISKNERLRGLERRNLTEAYEKRFDLVDQQRQDAVDQMKGLNDERIDSVLTENRKLLRNADRDNKSRMGMTNARHREDRENLIQQHKDQVTQISNNAESRVKKVLDLTNKRSGDMERYYADSLDTVKANYMDRMDAYRDKTVSDQTVTNKVMTERFRNMEAGFNSKLEQTVKTYEDKIAQLKESNDREIKRLENLYSTRSGDREKAVKMEKESLAMKYEAKLAQLNESHQDQLDRMNRRHQEDMQNLSVKMSSYSRKA